MAELFRREALAEQMAQQLLQPKDDIEGSLRSGLFFSGLRRTGKTTFLRQDLIPSLEAKGAIVIYVDLWSDVQASPAVLAHSAIAGALTQLEVPGSGIVDRLKRLKALDVGAAGFKLGFQLDSVGQQNGPTIAEALTAVVDKAKTDVVMIVDEVQHALMTEDGKKLLLALKSARDAINPRRGTPGSFIFIGTGSHRAQIAELSAGRNQAFSGAELRPYPVLEGDYVRYLLDRLAANGRTVPSLEVGVEMFAALGSRPEELLKALQQLQRPLPAGVSVDAAFRLIADTVRVGAADLEMAKVAALGSLAELVFAKIASQEEATGLYSGDTLAEYSKGTGSSVTADQVQRITRDLALENVIMRVAHGRYQVSDPFVRQMWAERNGQGGSGDQLLAPPTKSDVGLIGSAANKSAASS